MKRLLIAASVALALPACADVSSIPTSPGQIAGASVLDEKVGIAVEEAYRASRVAMEFAVDAGLLTGARATQARELNQRAFAATQAVQRAYAAGNATDYATGTTEAIAAVRALLALLKGPTS